MPPKFGEKYDDLYIVSQDGKSVKLDAITDCDIGASEPPEGLNVGGFVPYDEYRPPVTDMNTCIISVDTALWAQLKLDRFNTLLFYAAIFGMTKREKRMAVRLSEKIRREDLKHGTRRDDRLAIACRTIINRRK